MPELDVKLGLLENFWVIEYNSIILDCITKNIYERNFFTQILACGGNFFTPSGVLHSPDWPNNYGHGRECTWVIQVSAGRQIMLNFTVFDMENHTDCRYDFLEIRLK